MIVWPICNSIRTERVYSLCAVLRQSFANPLRWSSSPYLHCDIVRDSGSWGGGRYISCYLVRLVIVGHYVIVSGLGSLTRYVAEMEHHILGGGTRLSKE